MATAILVDCEADMDRAREIVRSTESMAPNSPPTNETRYDPIVEFDRMMGSEALALLSGDCGVQQQRALDAKMRGLWQSLLLWAVLPIPLGLLLAVLAMSLCLWIRGGNGRTKRAQRGR